MRKILTFSIIICLMPYVYGGQIEKEPPYSIPGVIFTAAQTDSVKAILRAEGTWTPTADQIKELEVIFPVYILTYKGPEADFVYDNLSRYKRQYLGIYRDGEKLIYVNGIYEIIDQQCGLRLYYLHPIEKSLVSFFGSLRRAHE